MSFKTPSLFRALSAYRLTSDVPLLSDLAGLNEQLAKNPERLPTFSQLNAHGWRPTLATRRYEQDQEGTDPEFLEDDLADRRYVNAPDGRASSLIHLEMIKWERQVPSWEVKNRMRERLDKIETNEKRKVYKKERDQIKDEVIKDVMIKAFVKASVINVLILPEHRLVLIDNVLWGGSVADPAEVDRDTQALRALNAKLVSDPRVDLALLAVGDGMTCALKR